MLMTPDVQALRSARRRISVLYMAGSGGEAAAIDLRLAIDEIDAALESVPQTSEGSLLPIEVFASWLASGQRGVSSEAMVAHMTGHKVGRGGNFHDHPHDLDDFRRCEMLLRDVPAARPELPKMAEVSQFWGRLVDRWDEIVGLFEVEVPNVFDSSNRYWRGYTPESGALFHSTLAGAS